MSLCCWDSGRVWAGRNEVTDPMTVWQVLQSLLMETPAWVLHTSFSWVWAHAASRGLSEKASKQDATGLQQTGQVPSCFQWGTKTCSLQSLALLLLLLSVAGQMSLALMKEHLSHPFLVANVEFGSKQPRPLMPTDFLLLQVGPHQCLTLCLTLLLHLCSR